MTYDVTSPHSIILSTVDQEATMRRRGSTETLESVRLGHAMLESYPRALSKLLNRFYNPIGPAQVLYFRVPEQRYVLWDQVMHTQAKFYLLLYPQ